MAKLFISLLAVLVVLNTLTFLMVANQESPGAEDGSSSMRAGAATASSDPRLQKIDRIEATVSTLRTSVDNLSRKIDSLSRRPTYTAPRATSPAAAPSVSSRLPRTPSRRTGPTEFSTVEPGVEEVVEGTEAAAETFVDENYVEGSATEPVEEVPPGETGLEVPEGTPGFEEGLEPEAPVEGGLPAPIEGDE